MADRTAIEWTDATWNPIRGCSRVSEGCRNCYAERQAARFAGPGQPYEGLVRSTPNGPRWTGQVRLVEEVLDLPLRWRKPRRIFVNSMSDLFHPAVPDEWIDRIFAVMLACRVLGNGPGHVFQILTKRPERMLRYLTAERPERLLQRWASAGDGLITMSDPDMYFSEAVEWACSAVWLPDGSAATEPEPWSHPENLFPLSNVWLGVSVEDQQAADERIPLLLQTPAAVRFVSCEPLLGLVDLTAVRPDAYTVLDVLNGCGVTTRPAAMGQSVPNVWTERLDWVVVGGESGPGARPMHPDWVRSIRDACVAAGVPFFFKQWGEWAPYIVTDGDPPPPLAHLPEEKLENWWTRRDVHVWESRMVAPPGLESYPVAKVSVRVGKKRAGALLDGREWREWPDERMSANASAGGTQEHDRGYAGDYLRRVR